MLFTASSAFIGTLDEEGAIGGAASVSFGISSAYWDNMLFTASSAFIGAFSAGGAVASTSSIPSSVFIVSALCSDSFSFSSAYSAKSFLTVSSAPASVDEVKTG